MTLSRALTSAYTGLASTSYRADVTAGNISNASTPGYVRRNVVLSENITGNRGNGVRISGVERHQDIGLTRLRRGADASVGRAEILVGAYDQLNRELGSPGEGYGLFAAYESLESSLTDLSVTPESAANLNNVLTASTDLVNQFNALSDVASKMRNQADSNIARDVETVNTALNRLQQLNGDISGRNQNSGETVALEDERQRIIDTIAQIIPVKDLPREGGTVDLMTETGVFLLAAGTVKPIEFSPVAVISTGASFANGTLSGLTVGNQDITPGAGGNFSLSSGTLAGHFAIRDTVVPEFNQQIDGLAGDLISRLSDDGLDPTKTAGTPGLFTDGGLAFDPANTTGIAGRIRLNAAIDPVQGGAATRIRDGLGAVTIGPTGNDEIINGLIEAITATQTAPTQSGLTGNFSSTELVAAITSITGENRIRHDSLAAGAVNRSQLLSDAELQKSGVDTDLELQNLLLIEQSYAANARVIQTVSDMLDRLMQL